MWTEERLNKMLTTPSEALSVELGRLEGDILVLGAGGKMGPTLCVLAKNALRAAGVEKRVIAVSRFSDPLVVELLRENGVEMISADLLAPGALDSLPDAENVIYMAGKKFGTDGNEYATWAMNTWLPSRVAERYQNHRHRGVLQREPVPEGGCAQRGCHGGDADGAGGRVLHVLPGARADV